MNSDSVRNLFMSYVQVEEDARVIKFEEFEKIVNLLKDDKGFAEEVKHYASYTKNEANDAREFFRYMIYFARKKVLDENKQN